MNDLDWKVTVPEYNANGVRIKRFVVTQDEADFDKLRTALNPQRPDRSIEPGTFTKLEVDDVLWMSDTPAECADLRNVDYAMRKYRYGTMLIAGLGLGVVVHRAILRGMMTIDVVEAEGRVLDAVGPHYMALAKEHGCELRLHHSDIHAWRSPRGQTWHIGFFDIWPNIDQADLPEVARLRRRFRKRLCTFEAWAQYDRLQSAKRIRTGTGFY